MEKKMENEMENLGPFKGGIYRDITPILENQMEKKMENDMEIRGSNRGYIGIQVYK